MATFRRTLLTNQFKQNLVLYITNALLEAGYYRNIAVGELDHEDNDLSECVLDPDISTFVTGRVWKSPRENWVHEGGLVLPSGSTAPIVPSGVYIDGTFYAKAHATYGHAFDYNNGRVIFNSAVGATSSVQLAYTHKEFGVFLPNNKVVHNLHNDYFANDAIEDEGFPFGYTSTPAIYVEVAGHELTPYALGGGKNANKSVFIHIVATDKHKHEIADIADLLSFKQFTGFNLINIDTIPGFLDFKGEKVSGYVNYKSLISDPAYYYDLGYFLQVEPIIMPTERENWNRIRLDCTIEVRDIIQS